MIARVAHDLIFSCVCDRRAYPRRFLGRVGRTPYRTHSLGDGSKCCRGKGLKTVCFGPMRISDGSKIVDVDRRPDCCPGGTPAPLGERGESPPPSSSSLASALDGRRVPPSGPWPPWRRRGRSPSEIGSPSLFSFVSRFPDLALHGFLNSWRSVTLIGLKF